MPYSTGEIAELCGVTVRTVQYYDREGLLKPDRYSEGGRRLYGDDSLKNLQIICLYRGLGLSLSEIKKVLSDEANSRNILLSLLEQREKSLDGEIREKNCQCERVKLIRRHLAESKAMDPGTFVDVQAIMKGKKKLKATYAMMLAAGLVADAAEAAFIVLWAACGLWAPFAVGMPFVCATLVAVIAIYYRNTQYICAECGKKFKPRVREWCFSSHTLKTRKLTCPHCGKKNYHIETYS